MGSVVSTSQSDSRCSSLPSQPSAPQEPAPCFRRNCPVAQYGDEPCVALDCSRRICPEPLSTLRTDVFGARLDLELGGRLLPRLATRSVHALLVSLGVADVDPALSRTSIAGLRLRARGQWRVGDWELDAPDSRGEPWIETAQGRLRLGALLEASSLRGQLAARLAGWTGESRSWQLGLIGARYVPPVGGLLPAAAQLTGEVTGRSALHPLPFELPHQRRPDVLGALRKWPGEIEIDALWRAP